MRHLRSIVRRDTSEAYDDFLKRLAQESGIETPTREHLAHKAEHAVDLETGLVLAVTLQPATDGDTRTVHETLAQCGESICEVTAGTNNEKVGERVNPAGPAEACSTRAITVTKCWPHCSERRAHLLLGTEARAPELGRQSRREVGGLRKPAPNSRRSRTTASAATRRASRAQLCAHV